MTIYFYLKESSGFPEEESSFDGPEGFVAHNSPDLNVCDYWLFVVIKVDSNVTSHPSVNSLKADIRRAFGNLLSLIHI